MRNQLIRIGIAITCAIVALLMMPHAKHEKVAVFGRTLIPCPPRCGASPRSQDPVIN